MRRASSTEGVNSGEWNDPNRKNQFRLRGKTVFLTYMFDDAGVGPSADDIKQKLLSLNAKVTVAFEEAPTTGRSHFHVYAQHNGGGFNTRNVKYFDVNIFHPNVKQVTRGHERVWNYVVKGGDVRIEDVPKPDPKSKKASTMDEVFRAGLQQPSFETMLSTIEENAPFKFATSFTNIRECARFKFRPEPQPDYAHPPEASFDISKWPEVSDWISSYIPDVWPGLPAFGTTNDWVQTCEPTPSLCSSSDRTSEFSELSELPVEEAGDWWVEPEVEIQGAAVNANGKRPRYESPSDEPVAKVLKLPQRPKSLILYGQSRTGKTCFARSLGKHVHHSNTINMEEHRDDVAYAVFDDIGGGLRGFDYKAWLGGQNHFNVTDKYMKKRSITWGKPSIYLCNENPYDTDRGVDFDWLRANTVIVHIDSPMFVAN